MATYHELQEALAAQLSRAAGLPEMPAAGFNRLLEKLRQNRFNLVMLGAFKRGKSSLINALLGQAVLPTGIVPLTSVVTILGYGEKLDIQVHFFQGESQRIGAGELVDYITEKGNPRNRKGVREVEIAYPSEYLQDGVRIIDTPGVGSVYQHNSEVAYNYLPQVDAAVFVVTVDPPLSASEQAFLKDIREYVHKLFFVLNKTDYVDAPERQEALEFTTRVLQDNLGTENLTIFPLSAKLALNGKSNGHPEYLEASLLPSFEQHLRSFLYKEKGRVLLISCINGALKALTDSTLALKVERQAGLLSLQELEDKVAKFKEELGGLEKEREISRLLLDGRIKTVSQEIQDDLEVFKKATLERLTRTVEHTFQEKSRSAADLRQEMEEFLFSELRQVFTTWRRQEIDKIIGRLAEIHQEFAGRINTILERLTRLTAQLFDFSLRGFTAEETFSEKSQFWFKFKEEPVGLEILQMTVVSLLPRALTKGMLLKKLLENVGELVDKHCGRLNWDFQQRLQEIARDFRGTWFAKIDDTTGGITQALERVRSQKQTDSQAAGVRLGQVEQGLNAILEAESQFLKLKEEVEAAL
jgi:ribosome biogenesis GTPase A